MCSSWAYLDIVSCKARVCESGTYWTIMGPNWVRHGDAQNTNGNDGRGKNNMKA